MTDRVILRAASAALALANFLFVVWLLGPGTCQKMEGKVTGLMYCTLPSGEEITFMKTLPPEIFMLTMLGSLLAGVLVARWVVASAKPR